MLNHGFRLLSNDTVRKLFECDDPSEMEALTGSLVGRL